MKKGGKGVSIIHLSCCSFGIGIYQGSDLQEYGMHNDGSVEYILLGIPHTAQGVLASGISAVFRFYKDSFLGGLSSG